MSKPKRLNIYLIAHFASSGVNPTEINWHYNGQIQGVFLGGWGRGKKA